MSTSYQTQPSEERKTYRFRLCQHTIHSTRSALANEVDARVRASVYRLLVQTKKQTSQLMP